jgi:hypothetical protein
VRFGGFLVSLTGTGALQVEIPAETWLHAYDRAMGLFRSTMGLFRSRAGKNPDKEAAELPIEQTRPVRAQPEAAPREVKREARPDPDKPGWGRNVSL